MIEIRVKASIADAFSDLMRGGNYEKLILVLMNNSQKIFPHQYLHNDKQPRGECDFVDIHTGEKYDAKLAFGKTEGKLIGSNRRDFEAWYRYMLAEEVEFSECITPCGLKNIENLTLYKTIENLLQKIAPDENAIFLIPYPIAPDGKLMHHVHFSSDILSAIFNHLRKCGAFLERRIYTIYPAMDHTIVLRCMNNNAREYISCPELDSFIRYDFT